jgi:hypothetical protein
MGWSWLTPLAVVFGFNIYHWLSLFNFLSKLLLMAVIASLGALFYSINEAFSVMEWLLFFPVILLTYFYQRKTNRHILILAIPAYLLLSYVVSERSSILFLGLMIIFVTLESLRQSGYNLYIKTSLIITTIVIGALMVIPVNNLITDITQNQEATADTRTFLFEELYADMSDHDLLVGRGALGTYHSTYFEYTAELGLAGDSPTRSIVEVGYLQMILKGGYIMMGLYLLILVPAAYLGIFKSNNIIARMSGYLILSYLLLWMITYPPTISPEYILLWMAAGTAMSTSARKITNNEIMIKRKSKLTLTR